MADKKKLGSAVSKRKALGKSHSHTSKRQQMEKLQRQRREAEEANDQERLARIRREMSKLTRGGYRSATSGKYKPAARQEIRFAADPETRPPAPPEGLSISLFLDTDDAVTTLNVIKAMQRMANELGYETPTITDVERGSIIANFAAAWGSQKGQKVIADSKAKAKEIIEEAEQYARLQVQKEQASVDAMNVSSSVELMTAYADVPRVALKFGAILFVKYPGPDGTPVVISRTLSTREIRAYERLPTIGANPELVEQNLALLVTQEIEEQKAVDQEQRAIEQ
jgi:hypothetical protein